MPRAPLPPCICGFHYSHECPRHGVDKHAPKKKGNPIVRGADLKRTPIKQKSDKQAIREAFLAGVKAERIRNEIGVQGFAMCEDCGVKVSRAPGSTAAAVESNMRALDVHHIRPRSSGKGFTAPNDHGVDSPTNLVLLCRKCHSATEPDPAWSSDRADASQGQAAPPTEESA